MCTLEKIVFDSQSVTASAIEGDEIALTLQSGQTVRTGIDRGLFVGHYSDMGAALIDAVRQGMPLTAERVHYVDEKPEEAFWIFWAEDFPAATIVED